jgi:hypothetical protein
MSVERMDLYFEELVYIIPFFVIDAVARRVEETGIKYVVASQIE